MNRSKKKKKEEIPDAGAPAWMTIYGDMMTLLLCFFVLLLSFSSIDEGKFSTAIYFIQGALGILPDNVSVNKDAGQPMSQLQKLQEMNLEEKVKKIDDLAIEQGLSREISVEISEGGMLIRLGSQILFKSGSAVLKKEAHSVLQIIGETIADVTEVIVAGHTDNLPITSGKFKSNWQLSSERSISVINYLTKSCNVPSEILVASGYSEYKPLVENNSPENRKENRRVEFLISW